MAIDIYLKFEGPDLAGESRDHEMADQIELSSWNWMHNVQYNMDTGQVGGRINVHPISFTKDVDKSSPILIQKMADNEAFDAATITVRKTQPGGHFPYYVIKLTNARIVDLATSVSSGMEKISESGTIVFTAYEIEYQPEAPEGGPDGGTIPTSYDLLAHTS